MVRGVKIWNILFSLFTNKSLEAGTLTSSGLFLDRHDLEHFIFQGRSQEEINDFKFLLSKSFFLLGYSCRFASLLDESYFDGEREKVNLFE